MQWRFHPGDDPRWADPAFDDSAWSLLDANRSWNVQGFRQTNGVAWYRLHIALPPDQAVSVAPGDIQDCYQLFADGRLIGHWGTIPGSRIPPPQHGTWSMIAPVPPHSGELVLALRVWTRTPLSSSYANSLGGFNGDAFLLGSPTAIRKETTLRRNRALASVGPQLFLGAIYLLAGLLTLALFRKQPSSREYLWFAVILFCFALTNIPSAVGIVWFTNFFFDPYTDIFASLLDVAIICFFFSFVGEPIRRFARWIIYAQVPLLLSDLFLARRSDLGSFLQNLVYVALNSTVYITVLTLLLVYGKRSRAARRLRLPMLLLTVTEIFFDLQYTLDTAGVTYWRVPDFSGTFWFGYGDATRLCFLLTMAYILVERFADNQTERTRLVSEFEAARQVQQLLVPATAPETPGFHIESVYLPAQEVGGDFFLVLPATQPQQDGSLLVVIGDVSGKGLKAAMIVSSIVGALRGVPSREPAEVLLHLNGILAGHISGFATCCALLIYPDGRLHFANAGNPPPYWNGLELPVAPGLPLGITTGTAYEQSTHQLAPGDQLTFVSDGVVEATASANRELFGFDRTQAISTQSASSIAEAARLFGAGAPQADDITVLTLTRNLHPAVATV